MTTNNYPNSTHRGSLDGSVRSPSSAAATSTAPGSGMRRRSSAVWKADLLGLFAIGTVVTTTWIWARTGGFLQTFVYPQYIVESQALYTGLLASNLMILQVLYMARIPWVEQAWGHDLLARRHRLLGFWSFWLMMAHVVLFAISRWGQEPDQPFNALWTLFVTDSWMLLASIGTFMIIVVVVTSIRAARTRLRYESWHLIHLYAYLGMALALPHQIFDGTHFHDLWTQVYWWALYFGTLAAVLLFRVGYPIRRSLRHRLRVSEVTTEAPGVVSISMRGRDLDKLRTKSGQFFIWRFLGGAGWTRGHPYTVSAAPHPEKLRVTVQTVGGGSQRASTIEPGTSVLIEGPYGTLTDAVRRHSRMVLIAAGVGITPFIGMLEDSDFTPGETTLIYRVRSADHAIHRDELEELARTRGVTLHLLAGHRRSSDSWFPEGSPVGNDTQLLTALVPDIANSDVFLCGPPKWNHAVRRTLKNTGTSGRDIHVEDFSW